MIFWKASAFRNPADAVIITTQADVTNPDEYAPCTPTNRMNCDAFADFRSQLIKHAAAFKGPVLLIHGDTGPYCLDKTFGGSEAPNIWRLNAGGDYHQPLDATVVTYRLARPAIRSPYGDWLKENAPANVFNEEPGLARIRHEGF